MASNSEEADPGTQPKVLHPYQALKAIQHRVPITLENGQAGSKLVSKLVLACALRIYCCDLDSGQVEASWDATQHDSKGHVIHLSISPDRSYLALATSEDKAVHILSLPGLAHLNKRTLPKRPSGLTWTPDSDSLLVCDKFGDVYSLPLHPPEQEAAAVAERQTKRFKPTATNLTVHTERNLRALENQQRNAEKAVANGTAQDEEEKEGAMAPVLGHVSMLTDMISTRVRRRVNGQVHARDYVITADRDEHIRISRGAGQEHVIEGYCLGHKSFISKLCLLDRGRILVSGGGEKDLRVWEWASWVRDGVVRRCEKVSLDPALGSAPDPEGDFPEGRFAVSGMWPADVSLSPEEPRVFAVACEGVPLVQVFRSNSPNGPSDEGQIEGFRGKVWTVPGNVLDAAWVLYEEESSQVWKLVLSLDNYHQTSSTKDARDASDPAQRLWVLDVGALPGKACDQLGEHLDKSLSIQDLQVEIALGTKLDEVLYSTERLRKSTERKGDDGED